MDDIDITNERLAREEAGRLRVMRARQEFLARRRPIIFCQDCGAKIPAARREAVPGCDMCVPCASAGERRGGFR